MEIEELKQQLESFDRQVMAKEVVWWLVENVKNFISTDRTNFSLSFLADIDNMPEMNKLELLCHEVDKIEIEVSGDPDQMMRAIEDDPEVAKAAKMQELIIDLMEEVRSILAEDEEAKQAVLSAFSFYHDFVGINLKTGEEITKDMDGFVTFDYLSFENVENTVTKIPMTPIVDEETGRVIDYKRDPSRAETYVMPAAFCIDISVQVWEDKGETSLF